MVDITPFLARYGVKAVISNDASSCSVSFATFWTSPSRVFLLVETLKPMFNSSHFARTIRRHVKRESDVVECSWGTLVPLNSVCAGLLYEEESDNWARPLLNADWLGLSTTLVKTESPQKQESASAGDAAMLDTCTSTEKATQEQTSSSGTAIIPTPSTYASSKDTNNAMHPHHPLHPHRYPLHRFHHLHRRPPRPPLPHLRQHLLPQRRFPHAAAPAPVSTVLSRLSLWRASSTPNPTPMKMKMRPQRLFSTRPHPLVGNCQKRSPFSISTTGRRVMATGRMTSGWLPLTLKRLKSPLA